jgi:hypothetical protein
MNGALTSRCPREGCGKWCLAKSRFCAQRKSRRAFGGFINYLSIEKDSDANTQCQTCEYLPISLLQVVVSWRKGESALGAVQSVISLAVNVLCLLKDLRSWGLLEGTVRRTA